MALSDNKSNANAHSRACYKVQINHGGHPRQRSCLIVFAIFRLDYLRYCGLVPNITLHY